MPCIYRVHKDKGLVVTMASGLVTFAEAMGNEDKIGADPDFDPGFAHLIDATGITTAELRATELSTLAQRTTFSAQSRKAVVVSSVVLFGLARMFEAYSQLSGAESVSVFRDRVEALKWLGISGEL